MSVHRKPYEINREPNAFILHEADHGETDERGRLASVTLVVACQPTTAADPGQGAFHDPSFRQHDEPVPVAAAHDLKLPSAGAGDGGLHLLPLIAGVADDALDKREAPSSLAEQSLGAVAVLYAGGVDVDGQQQAKSYPSERGACGQAP